jgi:5-formyltetrahydrofolate cyclo-ligase
VGGEPNHQQLLRNQVWDRLRDVARPDSRFHWDFSSFIPDFAGSAAAAERLRTPAYERADTVFVTPDNSLEQARRLVLGDGKRILATTYGIGRGFFTVDGRDVAPADGRHAATLDGIEEYARPVAIAELADLGPLPLLVTGAAAVTRGGVRIGKGHGYFDLEWALLSEVGALADGTEIVALVHDLQVLAIDVAPAGHDVVVDRIVTPTRALSVGPGPRPPGHVDWDLLDPDAFERMPCLGEARTLLRR